MQAKRFLFAVVAMAGVAASAPLAQAQFSNLSQALWLAGFQIDGAPNPITKGWDFTSRRSFFPGSNTLNFGVGTLTLNGSLGFNGSYTRRPFAGISFGIHSSAIPGGTAQPLSYTISIPRAVESLTITGTVTLDTSFTVDQTGFYHRVIDIDNRGTVKTTGAIPSENNLDFTLGPIDQTGNIFLQGISALLGKGQTTTTTTTAGSILPITAADLDSLDLDDPEQLAQYVNAVLISGITQAALDPSLGDSAPVPMFVPEPSTLLLLVLSGSMCLMGLRRRHAGG